MVMISCIGTTRDTALNIKATKEFTINMISEPFVELAIWTSVDTPPGHSEWPGSSLTMAPSVSPIVVLILLASDMTFDRFLSSRLESKKALLAWSAK
jgi:flavin reductase (DIM6/NTAB) family NADH-FMN oxidoreductase RutF